MIKTILSALQLALANIRANFFHTLLSVLGIVIGVASLVAILSLIDGMEQYAREQISKTTSINAVNVEPRRFKNINNVRVMKDSMAVIASRDIQDLQSALTKEATIFTSLISVDEIGVEGKSEKIGVERVAVTEAIMGIGRMA